MRGDNPSGAGNQQERPGLEQWVVGKATHWLLGSWNPQRPYADQLVRHRVEDMVLAPWRHGDSLERNSLSGKFRPARMA